MRAAPARSHATAVSTSSSGVVGSAGTSALAVSAPVGATVISVLAALRAGLMRLILPARRLRLRSRSDDDRLRGGEVVDEQLERRVGVALDHRERDGSVDVVARDGGDPADDAVAGADLAPLLRQDVPGAVEVQEDEAARRSPEVVDASHGLLTAVAALVQVHGRPQPVELVDDRAVVGLEAETRPPGGDAEGLRGPEASERPIPHGRNEIKIGRA